MRFFTEIKNKPKEVRKLYAFWSSVVITTLIGLVWLGGVTGKVSDMAISNQDKDSIPSNFAKVLGDMRASVGSTFSDATREMEKKDTELPDAAPTVLFDTESSDFKGWMGDNGETYMDADDMEIESTTTSSTSASADMTIIETASSTESNEDAQPEEIKPRVILIGTTTIRHSTTSNP